jgi:hypothetical protein
MLIVHVCRASCWPSRRRRRVRWMSRRDVVHVAPATVVAKREAVRKAFPRALAQPTPPLTMLAEASRLSAADVSTACSRCIHEQRARASFQHLGNSYRGIFSCSALTVEEEATDA